MGTGARGTKKTPITGGHLLFTFLTTDANDDVRPIHAKAMPAILTTPEEFERWLTVPMDEALELQRPLPAGVLKIVAATSRKTPTSSRRARRERPPAGWHSRRRG